MNLPSDAKIIFLVCDDIREEAGGKSSLLGLYGDQILVHSNDQSTFVMPSLACYFAFVDGDGEFDFQFNITDPKGKTLLQSQEPQKVKKNEGSWMNIALKLMPLSGPFGPYTVQIQLDGTVYQRQFLVHQQLMDGK